jgi:hypothetical protein
MEEPSEELAAVVELQDLNAICSTLVAKGCKNLLNLTVSADVIDGDAQR